MFHTTFISDFMGFQLQNTSAKEYGNMSEQRNMQV